MKLYSSVSVTKKLVFGRCDTVLNNAVKCVITSISTFPHRAHNITPFDAVGLMLLETSAKVFLPWGKKYFRIYFATTATKYDMRY